VKKHPNARVFSFGIGTSVNRFLLDKMAEAGRGEAEFVTLEQNASPASDRLFERMRTPLLTDITVEWNGLPVKEVYPALVPDVFAAKPVVIYGRYNSAANGTITIRGRRAGAPYEKQIQVELPQLRKEHDVLGSLWARQKIGHLMAQDWSGLQGGTPKDNLKEQITELGLEHRLMTQFTSFVAVEEQTVTTGGEPRVIQVPVEMPKGVSYEGIFGRDEEDRKDLGVSGGNYVYSKRMMVAQAPPPPPPTAGNGPHGANQTIEVTATASPIDMTSSSVTTTIGGTYPFIRSLAELGPIYDKHEPKEPDSKRSALEKKLDATVLASWECRTLSVAKVNMPEACKKVRTDSVHVEITLGKASQEVIAKLQSLGFVFDPGTKRVIGMMPVAKLNQVAAMNEVLFVKYIPTKA